MKQRVDGLVQERRNSSALAMELRLSCTNSSMSHNKECTNGWLPAKLSYLNILKLRQNGCHFADNIFKSILLNETVQISINISLKLVAKSQINNISALV